MASYSTSNSSRTKGSSGISFSVSNRHNEAYQSGSQRNAFLNGRRTFSPRTNLGQNTFRALDNTSQQKTSVKKPSMDTTNFPTLHSSPKRSSKPNTANWSTVAAKKPPKKTVSEQTQSQKRDPNLLYNKNTGEYYPDAHMFKRRSGFSNSNYDRIREEEYEEELRHTLGDEEYYEWIREQEETEAYYDDMYSDRSYEEDYDY